MKNNSERLLSIDVLRGFDMFFIVGGATFITALCCTFDFENCFLVEQMKHIAALGCIFHLVLGYVWAVSSAGTLIVGWAFVHFLYRKKIFFKV